jgi:hypothetical protein
MTVLVITFSIMVVCVVLLIGEVRRYLAQAANEPRERSPGHAVESPSVNSWSRVWMISLTVLCLTIVAYGWLYPRALFLTIVPNPTAITPAYLQAYNVSCGVLIWLVFRSTIGRNQGGVKSVISLLAISGSVLATVLISNRHASIAMEEIQRHLSSLESSGSERNADVPRARGEFGEIERFYKTRLSQMASLAKDCERELAAIGWETILDPERLGRDSTLIMSNVIVDKAESIVAKYQTRTDVLCENSKQAVSEILVSEWAKQHMVNDIGRVLEEVRAGLDEKWSWEDQIIAIVKQVVKWLSSNRDAWGVENGVLVFANESDLSRYNSYMIKLDKVTSQQDAREKENNERNKELKRLKY